MALGGVPAEFIHIRALIAVSFGAMLVAFIPLLFGYSMRALLNFDPALDRPESVLG